MMSLVQAIRETGLSETAIRLYESKGLVHAPRSSRGAVIVTDRVVRQLHTIAAARRLGFSVDDCAQLLALLKNGDGEQASTIKQLQQLRQKRADLEALELAFDPYLGDDGPGVGFSEPIMETFSAH